MSALRVSALLLRPGSDLSAALWERRGQPPLIKGLQYLSFSVRNHVLILRVCWANLTSFIMIVLTVFFVCVRRWGLRMYKKMTYKISEVSCLGSGQISRKEQERSQKTGKSGADGRPPVWSEVKVCSLSLPPASHRRSTESVGHTWSAPQQLAARVDCGLRTYTTGSFMPVFHDFVHLLLKLSLSFPGMYFLFLYHSKTNVYFYHFFLKHFKAFLQS